jgi:hypothetical protein
MYCSASATLTITSSCFMGDFGPEWEAVWLADMMDFGPRL